MDTMSHNEYWAAQRAGGPCSLDDLPMDGLRQNLRLFHAAVDQSPAAVAITDGDGRFLYVNAKFLELTGYDRAELSDKALPLTRPADSADDAMWQRLRSGETWSGESCGQRKNGESYRESEIVTPVLDADGALVGLVSVREDITSKVQTECLHAHQDALDDLTGLLNGRVFNGTIAEYLRQWSMGGESFALILFEVDDARAIGERRGQEVVDGLLTELAQLVRRCLRTRDALARRGRADFAVLLPDTSLDRAEVIAERLRFSVASFPLAGEEATISLGLTSCLAGDDAGSLLARADQALYRAKSGGGNRFVCWTGKQYW